MVNLIANKGTTDEHEEQFELEHAQNILDFTKANPPRRWFLADPNFCLIEGQITPVTKEEIEED